MLKETRESRPASEPTGISKRALNALKENAKRMHPQWRSLRDKALRAIFKRGGEMLPGFDRKSWQEVRSVVLLFEENERKSEEEIPKQELSLDPGKNRIVRLGNPYRPTIPIKYPPIVNEISQYVIPLIIGNRYKEIPKNLSEQDIKTVRDDLYVLKVLYGFTLRGSLDRLI